MPDVFIRLSADVGDYSAIATAMTTALAKIQVEVLGLVATIAPIGIVIFGSVLCVKYAKKFFTQMSGT